MIRGWCAPSETELLTKAVVRQCFLLRNTASAADAALAADLACLAARFSLRDFPDFLLMVCRGDLSDIAGPLMLGAWLVPISRPYSIACTPLTGKGVPSTVAGSSV